MYRLSISKGVRLSATHALCVQGILLCKKLQFETMKKSVQRATSKLNSKPTTI